MKSVYSNSDLNMNADFEQEGASSSRISVYRFDIFKGRKTESGEIEKIRSVGSATLRDGFNTYIIELKTLLEDRYYLLPSKDPSNGPDFVILTRELSRNSNRKYFWNVVGEAVGEAAPNHGLLKLNWDLFGDDLYLNTHPKNSYEVDAKRPVEAA
jgi:hypothetical protein